MKLRSPKWIDLEPAVKTGIAALLSMLAYQALHLEHGYWAVISAIIVMQANLGGSIRASFDRLVGTAIGALLGTLAFRYIGRTPLSVGLGLTLTIFLCSWLGLKQSYRLAGVTASIVLLMGETNPWLAGWNRFLDVVLGVVIALVVSALWPSRARNELRRSVSETFVQCDRLLQLLMDCLHGKCIAEDVDRQKAVLRDRNFRNRDLLADAIREPGDHSVVRSSELLVDIVQRVSDHLFGMDYAAREMLQDQFQQSLSEAVEAVIHELASAMKQIALATVHHKMRPQLGPLSETFECFEDDFARRRSSGESLQFDKDELLRFYSFVYRLRETVEEVQRAADLLREQRVTGTLQQSETV
jgi:uncharacterized membrane protein YgaE (UPF0421/DUF939 family)